MFPRIRFFSTASVLAPLAFVFVTACSDTTGPSNGLHATTAAFSGGVNAGGVSAGGGNAGGGASGTATPPPTPTSCANITAFSNSNGYYSVWAAIWTQFAYTSSCGYAVTATFSYLNGNTGLVDFQRSTTAPNGTIDEDWAGFSVPYSVTMSLTDASGNVLASRSAVVTTKVGKTPGA
jgi:hypothetical protein